MAKILLFFELLVFIVSLICSVFIVLIPVVIMRLFKINNSADYWVRVNGTRYSRFILWLVRVKLKDVTVHRPDFKSFDRVCFISNHTSILDIPAIVGGLRVWASFIAKEELSRVPLINFWIDSLNCLYMKRGSLRESAKAIERGVEMIKSGIPMAIFPEGTRSKTGVVAPFKGGSFKLATRSEAVIIPIVIKGVRAGFEAMKGIKRKAAKIMMLDPIPTKDMTAQQLRDLPERVESIIRAAYETL